MHFDEAVNYLLSLGHETIAIKLGLDNIKRLLAALGSPERGYPAVQIAGTNGKGSTAAMLERICRASGLSTGLYTSPHLVSITERIRIGGQDITREEFARFAAQVRAASIELERETGALPTFFEQVTAIALLAFREARVELAILETGLGGRLDATTAASADTIAITPIALDHQEYLGHTLHEIAAEKAAVIRPHTTVVVAGSQPDEALAVIQERCRACGVTPRSAPAGDRINVLGADASGRLRVTFKTEADVYEDVRLSLRGRHQATNAAVAVALAEVLRERGFPVTREHIIEGLETAEHAGRLELLAGEPSLLFDGAHNAAGARALCDYLDEFVRAPLTLVFGAMRDKELDEIAATLFPAADKLILTRPTNPRAATLDALTQLAASHVFNNSSDGINNNSPTLAGSPAEALRVAEELTPADGVVCITGSLYLVGEVKSVIERRGR
ncbi:MAG TPA: folylpolyglutamate synthase/dihydrofolate synthase family protein [Pyrinomonadaceae bacterium]|nr:folylpolyglutamate synthase/dihydrofolate synthase family protein [Pyrinomonadaceae bacterium]